MNDSKWLFYSKKNFTTRFKNLRGNSMKLTNLNKIFLEEHTLKLNKFKDDYTLFLNDLLNKKLINKKDFKIKSIKKKL